MEDIDGNRIVDFEYEEGNKIFIVDKNEHKDSISVDVNGDSYEIVLKRWREDIVGSKEIESGYTELESANEEAKRVAVENDYLTDFVSE